LADSVKIVGHALQRRVAGTFKPHLGGQAHDANLSDVSELRAGAVHRSEGMGSTDGDRTTFESAADEHGGL